MLLGSFISASDEEEGLGAWFADRPALDLSPHRPSKAFKGGLPQHLSKVSPAEPWKLAQTIFLPWRRVFPSLRHLDLTFSFCFSPNEKHLSSAKWLNIKKEAGKNLASGLYVLPSLFCNLCLWSLWV